MPQHLSFDFPSTNAKRGEPRYRVSWPWKFMDVGDTVTVFVDTASAAVAVNSRASGYARKDDPYFTLRTKTVRLPHSQSYVLVRAVDSREESVTRSAEIGAELAEAAYKADLLKVTKNKV